ncbi:MAG: hypothetical protein RIC03_12480 [Cyclobacteriaceae bacterium]
MKIYLPIKKELLKCYLSYLFESEGNEFKVSATCDFGSAMVSYVRYSSVPVDHDQNDVLFRLPVLDRISNARNYHLYYNKEDTARLNELLRLYFNLDFDRYYMRGLKLKERQKDIIMSFIVSRKLTGLVSDVETLKKRHYRSELKILEERVKKMMNMAYQRNDKIEFYDNLINVNVDRIIYQ